VGRRHTHSLAGEGVVGPDSDRGTETLGLFVYFNPSTIDMHFMRQILMFLNYKVDETEK
jgi:hypothetical protein